MAPLLLKYLTSSLTRQLVQMAWIPLKSYSPTTSVYRCLSMVTAAPARLLMSQTRLSLSGSSAHCQTSLLGQCQHLTSFQPCAGMKTKTSIKRRCKDCFIVRRRGHLFVFCKTNPRHKQRQG